MFIMSIEPNHPKAVAANCQNLVRHYWLKYLRCAGIIIFYVWWSVHNDHKTNTHALT